MNIETIAHELSQRPSSAPMPALFIGHGTPLNALSNNEYTDTWHMLGQHLPKPKAILILSSHWLTHGRTCAATSDHPKTIHDFSGFPDDLYEQHYEAPGSPAYAQRAIGIGYQLPIEEDQDWGLDHGAWSILMHMYPQADIPCFQVSFDIDADNDHYFKVGQTLRSLREQDVLIIGSGNFTHNLDAMNHPGATDWAVEFDRNISQFIGDHFFEGVIHFDDLGEVAKLAHPSKEHFLPIISVLGSNYETDKIDFFNESFDLGSISMRSFIMH